MPLPSRSLATSSIRCACRSASWRIGGSRAITESCGLGRSSAGTISAPASIETRAGRAAKRGRNRFAGRRARSARERIAPLAADEPPLGRDEVEVSPCDVERRLVVRACGRGRRRASRPRTPARRRAASPVPPSASTAIAVSPTVGPHADRGDQQRDQPEHRDRGRVQRRARDRPDALGDRHGEHADGHAPPGRTRPRRTTRRSHRRRRCGGEPGPDAERAPDPARRRAIRAGSAGTNTASCPRVGAAGAALQQSPRHQVSLRVGRRRGRGRRSRQRRVGVTSWTDRTMRMSDSTSQAVSALRPVRVALDAELDRPVVDLPRRCSGRPDGRPRTGRRTVGDHPDDPAVVAEPGLGAADHVGLGGERVEPQERPGRPPLERLDERSRSAADRAGRPPVRHRRPRSRR